MEEGWLLIAYFLMIFGSALFSAAENALAAVNKIRLRNLTEAGNRRAKRTLALTERFDQVLTSILIAVNALQIGGASVATLYVFRVFGASSEVHAVATTVATVVTTLFIFFVADLIPKSFAVAHPDGFAMALAPLLWTVTVLLFPVTLVFRGLSLGLRHVFGIKEEPTVTEEEISSIIDTVEEEGVIDEAQGDLLQSALEFADTAVADVLTLWEDVWAIELHATPAEVDELVRTSPYSRLPVYDGTPDHVVGVMSIRSYLKAKLRDEDAPISTLIRPPFFTTLDASIDGLLDKMSQAKTSMAIVKGEGDVTMGIVTVEDFLEELVGEIFDETDVVNDRFMKLGGNYFRVSGTCTLGEMFRDMGWRGKVNMSRLKTVASWVREQLGHTPEVDDTFEWRDLTVTVTEMDEERLVYAEVKLPHPVLDAVTTRDDDGEEGDA